MLKKPPKRVSFREREEIIDLPNLIEIQIIVLGSSPFSISSITITSP